MFRRGRKAGENKLKIGEQNEEMKQGKERKEKGKKKEKEKERENRGKNETGKNPERK